MKKSNHFKTYLSHKRSQCQASGVTFTLGEKDLPPVPDKCPVLGIPLARTRGFSRFDDFTPSLDRITPSRGYTPGNVVWVSFRANRIKTDAHWTEVRRVADFYEGLTPADALPVRMPQTYEEVVALRVANPLPTERGDLLAEKVSLVETRRAAVALLDEAVIAHTDKLAELSAKRAEVAASAKKLASDKLSLQTAKAERALEQTQKEQERIRAGLKAIQDTPEPIDKHKAVVSAVARFVKESPPGTYRLAWAEFVVLVSRRVGGEWLPKNWEIAQAMPSVKAQVPEYSRSNTAHVLTIP